MTELVLGFRLWDPLAWEIVPRLGGVISPHGLGIAVGYLAGAQFMVRRARKRGGPDEADIWNALFWALLGAIVGARVGYVIGHFSEVTDGGNDPLGVVKVWEGGISLLGGITGAVLFAVPYIRSRKMGFWRSADLAAPALALGIAIGRIGDLVIGDHLGKPTDFALGWLCLGEVGGPGPLPYPSGAAPALGCFAQTVHQTALYDFFSSLLLLGALLWLGRTARNRGFLALVFVAWYGTVRVITDFLRVDKRYFDVFTGSQLWALLLVAVALYLLIRYRGAPPRRAPEADAEAADVGPGPVRLEDPEEETSSEGS